MAQINDLYVHVTDEEITRDMEVSSHSVEQGIEITDTIRRKSVGISIKGTIVTYLYNGAWVKASEVIEKLTDLKNKGKLITYNGRNVIKNLQIESFNTSHPNTVWGGAEFDMELKERRFAKNAYVEPKIDDSSVANGGQQQVEKGENEKIYYTVKKGDTIWGLLTDDYKNLIYLDDGEPVNYNINEKCDWVMHFNPHAFSKKGDFRTLKVGEKILLGYRG